MIVTCSNKWLGCKNKQTDADKLKQKEVVVCLHLVNVDGGAKKRRTEY